MPVSPRSSKRRGIEISEPGFCALATGERSIDEGQYGSESEVIPYRNAVEFRFNI